MLVNSQLVFALHQSKQILGLIQKMVTNLQSSKVKGTLQDSTIDLIIQKLNPLVVVDFRFISAFWHVLWMNSHVRYVHVVMKFLPAQFSWILCSVFTAK